VNGTTALGTATAGSTTVSSLGVTGNSTLTGDLNVSGATTLGNTSIANNTGFSTGAGTGFFYGGATGSQTGANTISSTGVFTGTLLALTADQTESGTILGISAEGLKTGKAIDVSLGNVYEGTADGFGTIGAVNVRAKSFTGNIFNVSAEGISSATGILANFKSNQVAGTVVNVLGSQLTGGTAVSVSATGLNASGKAIAATVGAAGTPIYVDTAPSGYTGNLVELRANGAPQFWVNQVGTLTLTGNLNIQGGTLTGPTTAAFTIDNGGQAINIGGATTATLNLGKTGQITNVLGDFQVATNKFTVAAATGDTVVGGTLQVKGTSLTGSTTGTFSIDNGGQAINIGGATTAALNLGKTGQITNVLGTLTVGTSNNTTGSIALKNSTNGNTLTLQSGATSASHTLTLPTSQGAAGTVLQNDGSGTLSWATPAASINTVRKTADQSTSSTNYGDVTGLSFAAAANTDYAFEFNIVFSTAATTTGLGLTMNGPAGANAVTYKSEIATTTAAEQTLFATAYSASNLTTSIDTANANRIGRITGVIRNGATAGTVTVQFRSEVNGSSVTIRDGSWGTWY
jgi:hypothetical protein